MAMPEDILAALRERAKDGRPWVSSSELSSSLTASWSTIKRHLNPLVMAGRVLREGHSRSTRYRLPGDIASATVTSTPTATGPTWSMQSQELRAVLSRPLAMRNVVTYQRAFIDDYIPNESALLPPELTSALTAEGRMKGQQPAGTYARKVLEPLLIDLSWSSSHLEGNRYSLLDTKKLFESGSSDGDLDAVMLLNHKAAIEFLVDAVPQYGLTTALTSNLHALLMQDLLADTGALGNIRQKVVNISDTTYLPTQVPSLLKEIFDQIIDKARQIKSPIESAFFLWVNLAYLQPFEDGNKRTSRLAANIPLMLYNCAPLSFNDVDVQDYALAMMGIYEQCNVALAVDLFEWVYRRSIKKYGVTLEAMGIPDPMRLRFRETLTEAIGRIVRDGMSAADAIATLSLAPEQLEQFAPILQSELRSLGLHNYARYRLLPDQISRWLDSGRPQ